MAFGVVVVVVFVVLAIMNMQKGISRGSISKAIERIETVNQLLVEQPVDWDAVDDAYQNRSLVALVRETDRFLERARLHGKISSAIENGRKKYIEDFSPIMVRDTLFRVCLLHIEALLLPKDEIEARLSIEQRMERIALLSRPIYRYFIAENETRSSAYRRWFDNAVAKWRSAPGEETAKLAIEQIDLIMADMILEQIEKWRKLNKDADDERQVALLMQLHINQLYYVFYERLFDRIGETTRDLLLELDDDPREIDMDKFEDTIRQGFEGGLKALRG